MKTNFSSKPVLLDSVIPVNIKHFQLLTMDTDLMIKDGDFHSPLPLTGSHEPCGIIVEVGSKVKGFKKGYRIGTLPFMHPCGKCPDCKSGTDSYCDNMKGAMGINTDGAFGEVLHLFQTVIINALVFRV
jgi:D-arabinose 1-dehydrogenase-like Zn-dependent alcohol dehydrogenase